MIPSAGRIGLSRQIVLARCDHFEFVDQTAPATGVFEAEESEGYESEDNKEELEHFVVDGGSETAERDVCQNDDSGGNEREIETPEEFAGFVKKEFEELGES